VNRRGLRSSGMLKNLMIAGLICHGDEMC
jgi:hypothetical protein